MTSPLILGVAGGTGSGKTTVAQKIHERVGAARIAYVPHDAYYRDFSNYTRAQLDALNWAHPDSLDTELMTEHIRQLQRGEPAEIPVYDFTLYHRTSETVHLESQPVILVEGILIFADVELRKLFDVKIFVDTDADIRFIRRLKRDITERGRTVESVIDQYLGTVKPMHLEFAVPSKRYADIIIPLGGHNSVAIDMLLTLIRSLAAN